MPSEIKNISFLRSQIVKEISDDQNIFSYTKKKTNTVRAYNILRSIYETNAMTGTGLNAHTRRKMES